MLCARSVFLAWDDVGLKVAEILIVSWNVANDAVAETKLLEDLTAETSKKTAGLKKRWGTQRA